MTSSRLFLSGSHSLKEPRVSEMALRCWRAATVLADDGELTPMCKVPCMTYLLDLGDQGPLIRCRDAQQALLLARVFVAHQSGTPAIEVGHQS